jgi:Bacterial PH domain/Short C-terminal domain
MASFTESLLSSGETILLERRQHWLVLVDKVKWALLAIILAAVIFVVRGSFGSDGIGGTINGLLGWVALALVVYVVVSSVFHYIRWTSRVYLLTNRRVIQVDGILNKEALDTSLEKINDAVLSESLFGRMFGFGDLEILTATESGIDRMHMLVDAAGFKRAMADAKHDLELQVATGHIPSPPLRAGSGLTTDGSAGSPSPAAPAEVAAGPALTADPAVAPAAAGPDQATGPAPASSADVADSINRLKQLADSGAITQAEFEAKKAELLARL